MIREVAFFKKKSNLMCFYELVKVTKWQVDHGNTAFTQVSLKISRDMFDCKDERTKHTTSFLVLYQDQTYQVSGPLSMYDLEVLKNNKFREI